MKGNFYYAINGVLRSNSSKKKPCIFAHTQKAQKYLKTPKNWVLEPEQVDQDQEHIPRSSVDSRAFTSAQIVERGYTSSFTDIESFIDIVDSIIFVVDSSKRHIPLLEHLMRRAILKFYQWINYQKLFFP